MKREGHFGPLFLIVILFSHTHLTVTADDSVQKQLTILIQEAEC